MTCSRASNSNRMQLAPSHQVIDVLTRAPENAAGFPHGCMTGIFYIRFQTLRSSLYPLEQLVYRQPASTLLDC